MKVTEVTPVSGGILVEWVEGGLQNGHQDGKAKITKKSFGKKAMDCARPSSSNGKPRSAKEKAANEKDADHA